MCIHMDRIGKRLCCGISDGWPGMSLSYVALLSLSLPLPLYISLSPSPPSLCLLLSLPLSISLWHSPIDSMIASSLSCEAALWFARISPWKCCGKFDFALLCASLASTAGRKRVDRAWSLVSCTYSHTQLNRCIYETSTTKLKAFSISMHTHAYRKW